MTRRAVTCRLMRFPFFGHFEVLNIHDFINGNIILDSSIFKSKNLIKAESVVDS